jgi:tRNA(Leu) C34 or U34 (ribose-2'-O)-methylase TrmL
MNRGYSVIALDNPKFAVNVGTALRAASCYGADMIVSSGMRPKGSYKTDVSKAYRHIPYIHRLDSVFDALPYDCVPIAVDLVEGAVPLQEFEHPERGFYVFGGEDNTLGERILSKCKHKVYVPTSHCMNLAATVNVVLYSRGLQRGFPEVEKYFNKEEVEPSIESVFQRVLDGKSYFEKKKIFKHKMSILSLMQEAFELGKPLEEL